MTPAPLDRDRIDGIVIGASAGGVEALCTLLPALPADLRAAVLIVQHIPRDRPSVLAEIFAARCPLRVVEAEDKAPVERGTVYVAPPDYHLLVDRGPVIALSADELVNYSRPAIDVLFESAADAYGERLLGIVLTGASHDGAAGLHAVAQAGGVAAVQRPDTAQAPRMAQSALARAPGALALTLEEMQDWLRTLGHARRGAAA